MTRMTGPDYAVMCNLIHTHYTLHAHRNLQSEYLSVVLLDQRISFKTCLIPQLGDQYIAINSSIDYIGGPLVSCVSFLINTYNRI